MVKSTLIITTKIQVFLKYAFDKYLNNLDRQFMINYEVFKMKCNKCEKNIDKDINRAFSAFKVGYLKCEDDHLQNRYISELDLLVYFALSATLYGFLFLIISAVFTYIGLYWYTVVVLMILLALAINFYSSIAKKIYDKAHFKKEWKNFDLKEDVTTVQRRMRWQFIMFMVLAFFMGSSNQYLPFLFIFIILFLIIVLIKIYFTIKNERAEFNAKSEES